MKTAAKKTRSRREKKVDTATSSNAKMRSGLRAIEVNWMRTHREKLRPLAGQYVVVEGTRVVAHGRDASEVIRLARRHGVKIPFILYLEEPETDLIHVGL